MYFNISKELCNFNVFYSIIIYYLELNNINIIEMLKINTVVIIGKVLNDDNTKVKIHFIQMHKPLKIIHNALIFGICFFILEIYYYFIL